MESASENPFIESESQIVIKENESKASSIWKEKAEYLQHGKFHRYLHH